MCVLIFMALCCCAATDDQSSLVQTALAPLPNWEKPWDIDWSHFGLHRHRHTEKEVTTQSCSKLSNEGPYSSLTLGVGTPVQKFSVVADTGSDSVIIPSCYCSLHDLGCSKKTHCFSRKSATLKMEGKDEMHSDTPLIEITFGSGPIVAALATDVVTVAGVQAAMEKGVVLMLNRTTLEVDEHFEGILGLGPPRPSTNTHKNEITTPLFLQEAGASGFSVCFNDGEQQGSLRTGKVQMSDNALHITGPDHWSLGLEGLSVAKTQAASKGISIDICHPAKKSSGQEYPCGAIIDTGTTYMLGPKEHIEKLYEEICTSWPRCQEAAKSKPEHATKSRVFEDLLTNCGEWLDKDEGLYELPTIQFHLKGSKGSTTTLELSGWSYVFEYKSPEKSHTGRDMECVPAFDDNAGYTSPNHGAVWIFGTPVFFDHVVAHDLETSPPSIDFQKIECMSCDSGEKAATLMKQTRQHRTDRKSVV